jgi:tetratricopeptide (TPR) repeat protein
VRTAHEAVVVTVQHIRITCHIVVSEESIANWRYNQVPDQGIGRRQCLLDALPNDSRVFLWKGLIERRQGRWEESTGSLERAIELDPRNVFLLDQTAQSYQALRRHVQEKAIYDRKLTLESDDPVAKVIDALIELNLKADTQPAHEIIESIRATNPAATSSIADAWLLCSLAERNPTAATNALIALAENPINLASVDNARF